jgi:hypothetical protein
MQGVTRRCSQPSHLRYACSPIYTFASSGWVAYLFLVSSMSRRWIQILLAIVIGVFVTIVTAAVASALSSESA